MAGPCPSGRFSFLNNQVLLCLVRVYWRISQTPVPNFPSSFISTFQFPKHSVSFGHLEVEMGKIVSGRNTYGSVLQSVVAVCCRTLLWSVAECCSVGQFHQMMPLQRKCQVQCVAVSCSVLQCVVACCSVLQSVAECCRVLQCVAVSCSILRRCHCNASAKCSVLQCVAVCCSAL